MNQLKSALRIKPIHVLVVLLFFSYFGLGSGCKNEDSDEPETPENVVVRFFLTDPSNDIYFIEQDSIVSAQTDNLYQTIAVEPAVSYQEMDGFGFALTGGSAYHIHNLSQGKRTELLNELFDYKDLNIGVSYLRVSIGSSDLDFKVFSYDDLPAGQTDPDLLKFTLAEDRNHVIPVLKEILAINPKIKILGSPWSAPLWMKTNQSSIGGSLKPEFYGAYAKYFVKYVQEMQKEGIPIDAITVQNEPLHPGNNPSMYMPAADQADFIKNHLGPAFVSAGLQTKIIIYDHNADRTDYPISVLNDSEARKFIDGSAFHLYGGEISALTTVHNAHRDKNLYFTEQWIGAGSDYPEEIIWHLREIVIGATRNWCKTVIEWNLAADENQNPHTPGGCDRCLGALTITGDQVTRNAAYYIIAHASKFVRPGSFRVESSMPSDLPNVAFKTPDGKNVIIVLNNSANMRQFNINIGAAKITTSLTFGSVGTYIW